MSTQDYRRDPIRAVERARRLAHRAAVDMAAEDGPEIVTRPSVPGSRSEVRDVEPLAGFRAAHELKAGARYTARSYVRDAREGGATWHDIGLAMDPHLREDARRAPKPKPTGMRDGKRQADGYREHRNSDRASRPIAPASSPEVSK